MSVMDGIKSFMRPSGLDMDDDFDDDFEDDFDDFEDDEERSGGFFGGLFSRKKSEEEDYDFDDEEDEEPAPAPKRDVSFRGYNSYKSSDRYERSERKTTSENAAPRGTATRRTTQPQSQPQESTNTRTGGAKVIPMNKAVNNSSSTSKLSAELYMIKPRSEEDARVAVDELLNGKVVIVNLEGLNLEIAQYVTDFVTGANYSIGGNFSTINNQVLVFAPANVNMTGAFDEGIGDVFNF